MSRFESEFDKYFTKAVELLEHSSAEAVHDHISQIPDEDYRNSTFRRVASTLAERNRFMEAYRFCVAIPRPLERADAFLEVGRILRVKGNTDAAKQAYSQAVAAAEAIERDPAEAAAVLLQIASDFKEMHERDQAVKLLRRAIELTSKRPQAFEAGKTLRGCARLLAKLNLTSEAAKVAELIESPQLRSTTVEEIHGRGEWPVTPDSE